MTLKEKIQNEMKIAMKSKNAERLGCLRMLKGAVMVKEKESGTEATDDDVVAALRTELRKRKQSLELFVEHNKTDEAATTENEIAIIGEFLPQQLSAEQLEEKIKAYLAEHPEINHPGKLTGMMKKELGEAADGKMLNDLCQKVLSA